MSLDLRDNHGCGDGNGDGNGNGDGSAFMEVKQLWKN